MITFNKLGSYGRFGNQLFQYATLFAIGKRKNCDIGVPYEKANILNEYNKFCLPECFIKLNAKDSSTTFPLYFIQEKDFTFQPGLFGIPDGSDILGYFQTEKYFVDYRDQLLNEFTFKPEIYKNAINARSITKEPVISLHIRLGDYLKLQDTHPVCSIEYYKEALDTLPDDLLVYIFSDEPQKAQDIFNDLGRKIVFPEMKSNYEDMCLMTMCDYHIIANSSFSWWGAWLSNSKKTISPAKWFGGSPTAPKNWSDVYCKEWVVI